MKLGLIGKSIQNSKSPRLYRHFGAIVGQDIIYTLLDLQDNDQTCFSTSVCEFFANGGIGLSVTSPFKKTAFEFCDYLDQSCIDTKSVNTIIYKDGKFIGFNTDTYGFSKALEQFNFTSIPKALIIGTGDIVPTIVNCIKDKTDHIHITGRNHLNAVHLSNSLNIGYRNINSLGEFEDFYNLVINATPGEIVLPDDVLYDKVFDLSYNKNSPFIKYTIEDGKDYIQGDSMLLYQAIEAFKIYTGYEINVSEHPWLLTI